MIVVGEDDTEGEKAEKRHKGEKAEQHHHHLLAATAPAHEHVSSYAVTLQKNQGSSNTITCRGSTRVET